MKRSQSSFETSIAQLRTILSGNGVTVRLDNERLTFETGGRSTSFILADGPAADTTHRRVSADMLTEHPQKIAGSVLSQLGLNRRIFARNCEVLPVSREKKDEFLNAYHLMNTTTSAYNLGLFHEEELVALATFSKGRRMKRLPEALRSFELIRFCCKPGITVTGGLSRLVTHFCREKHAGDIMTYINTADTRSFRSAGFFAVDPGDPDYFLNTRADAKPRHGNTKMIFIPPWLRKK